MIRAIGGSLGRIGRVQRLEAFIALLGYAERKLDRYIRLMEKIVFPLHEAAYAPTENRRRDWIRRIHIFNQTVPEAGGKNRGNHKRNLLRRLGLVFISKDYSAFQLFVKAHHSVSEERFIIIAENAVLLRQRDQVVSMAESIWSGLRFIYSAMYLEGALSRIDRLFRKSSTIVMLAM